MIFFVLVGIGQGEFSQRQVETVALAQVAADGRGIPGFGMGTSQGPATILGIAFELLR